MRFSRCARLTTQRDFQNVWLCSNKIKCNQYLGFYRLNNSEQARVGITIKKQTIKLACRRNQIRRVIRESFRSVSANLKGLDIIILVRSECTPLDKTTMRNGIDKLWQQILAKSF